jgi:hypothetical protein
MYKIYLVILVLLCLTNTVGAQSAKLRCVETTKISDDDKNDPVLIKTCYFKNYKFVTISNPDGVGRYFPENEEHEVFIKFHGKYIKTKYSSLFNNKENELLDTINKRIHEEYRKNSTSAESKDCFTDIDSIPNWYKMDDLEISFEGNKICFSVAFGLTAVCRYVDGAIIEFKFGDIVKYFK